MQNIQQPGSSIQQATKKLLIVWDDDHNIIFSDCIPGAVQCEFQAKGPAKPHVVYRHSESLLDLRAVDTERSMTAAKDNDPGTLQGAKISLLIGKCIGKAARLCKRNDTLGNPQQSSVRQPDQNTQHQYLKTHLCHSESLVYKTLIRIRIDAKNQDDIQNNEIK